MQHDNSKETKFNPISDSKTKTSNLSHFTVDNDGWLQITKKGLSHLKCICKLKKQLSTIDKQFTVIYTSGWWRFTVFHVEELDENDEIRFKIVILEDENKGGKAI